MAMAFVCRALVDVMIVGRRFVLPLRCVAGGVRARAPGRGGCGCSDRSSQVWVVHLVDGGGRLWCWVAITWWNDVLRDVAAKAAVVGPEGMPRNHDSLPWAERESGETFCSLDRVLRGICSAGNPAFRSNCEIKHSLQVPPAKYHGRWTSSYCCVQKEQTEKLASHLQRRAFLGL